MIFTIMPKEQRISSHQFRQQPIPLHQEQHEPITHRSTSIWTAEDDETLMAARAQGMNWQPIANLHFPHKSGNACRKRHERLMEKRTAEDWDVSKLEKLAVEYMTVRREMWTMLAERMGEKWQNVEAKCMEKGIKNISASYKSALRKERGGIYHHHPEPDYQRDSGYGGSDIDAEYELEPSSTSALMTPATTNAGEPSSASSSGGGYVPHLAQTGPPSMFQQQSSHLRQHHLQPRYHPIPIQPVPSPAMMMRGGTMIPSSQVGGMSIHAMLSPSPPADDERVE